MLPACGQFWLLFFGSSTIGLMTFLARADSSGEYNSIKPLVIPASSIVRHRHYNDEN
jgi:hypothetical protein